MNIFDELLITEEKEETTIESLTESSLESSTEASQDEIDKIISPRIDLEAPKLKIPVDEENFDIDETTILPITESEITTINIEPETTTELVEKSTSTAATVSSSQRTPKLIIKPSIHVIPPPPKPTEFELLLTTLKEYVTKLENTLAATKATEADPTAAVFVNYTVSRSFNQNNSDEQQQEEKEESEAKSISKRSAPSLVADLIPRYFKHKHANKEKGCSYGKRQYKVGEKIWTDNECLECLCFYSPIGHCVKKTKCEA